MFYESLFNPSIHRPVKACLTGAGEFGASFLFQAQGMPLLEVPAVCTRTVQRAVDAYENAGIPASKVRVCESAEDAKKAYADGFNVVVDRFDYIADLPLDVLVESSGAPEASAAAAELAIERGMHVVMVSKETDSVVGSILARKAAERGLVYTTGDGDQPSLLIGLISWGRVLGMNIVGAGKSSEYDFIYDPARDMVLCPGQKQEIATPGMGSLWQFGDRPAEEVVGKRRAMLTSLSHRSVPDLCEMAVVANATGMMPDRPLFHAPVARIDEMPDLFCPKADGGLFDNAIMREVSATVAPTRRAWRAASSSSWNAKTKNRGRCSRPRGTRAAATTAMPRCTIPPTCSAWKPAPASSRRPS